MQNVLQMLEADIGGLRPERGHIAFLVGSVVLMAISLNVMVSQQQLALCARLLHKMATG